MTTNESPAKTDDLGAALKKIRTQRGWSLESVQQKTRIPRKFLEAMEANRFTELPAPVYLRGFLRTYCEFLDLEFDPIWARVTAEVEKPPVGAPPSGSSEPAPTPTPSKTSSPSFSSPSMPPMDAGPSPMLFLGGLAVFAVAALGIWAVARKPRASAPPPVQTEAPTIAPLHPRGPLALELEFPERTWIRVEADGRVRFEGWVPAKSKQSWTANTRFRLRTPSPDAVHAALDGKPAALSSFAKSPEGDVTIESPPQ